MTRSSNRRRGFSLIEVVLALGIMSFALLSVMALLPIGIKSNKISTEETFAVNLLTTLEEDLRGTHPLANSGNSQIFNLKMPYVLTAGRPVFNTSLAANTLASGYTIGMTDTGVTSSISATVRPRYQVSVIYTKIPAAGSLASAEARLIVNWPALSTTTVSQLTSLSNVEGYVETYVAFPAP